MRVDTRAGSGPLIAPLRRMGLSVEEAMLPAGDIEIVGQGVGGEPVLVGVEYKQWGDLLQSMRNGRLADQLRDMKKAYTVRWLLIEGRVRPRGKGMETWTGHKWFEVPGRITYQEVTSRLATVAASGVCVWRTETQDETLCWLRAFYHWWVASKWEDHASLGDFYQPPYGDGALLLEEPCYTQRVASVLPGIGAKKARLVAQTFGSPEAMMAATVEQWEEIEGVGPKTAKKLVDVFKGRVQR